MDSKKMSMCATPVSSLVLYPVCAFVMSVLAFAFFMNYLSSKRNVLLYVRAGRAVNENCALFSLIECIWFYFAIRGKISIKNI